MTESISSIVFAIVLGLPCIVGSVWWFKQFIRDYKMMKRGVRFSSEIFSMSLVITIYVVFNLSFVLYFIVERLIMPIL